MRSTVSARHGEVDPTLRDRAVSVLDRLATFAPQAVEGAVVFDGATNGQWAEIKLHLPGGRVLVATATEIDHRTALDRAEDKLRKQIDKSMTARRRGRRTSSNP